MRITMVVARADRPSHYSALCGCLHVGLLAKLGSSGIHDQFCVDPRAYAVWPADPIRQRGQAAAEVRKLAKMPFNLVALLIQGLTELRAQNIPGPHSIRAL